MFGQKLVDQALPDGKDPLTFFHPGLEDAFDNLLHALGGLVAGDNGGDDAVSLWPDDTHGVVLGMVLVLKLDVEGVGGCVVACCELGDRIVLAHDWEGKKTKQRL